MTLCFVTCPDDILYAVLAAHSSRAGARAVTRRWKQMADQQFLFRTVPPPIGRKFVVDFEIDRHMCKDMYCAKVGGEHDAEAVETGGIVEGSVTFLNWAPSYYLSAPGQRRDVKHKLREEAACGLWRLLATMIADREKGCSSSSDSGAADGPRDARSSGHLTVTEGCSSETVRRHVLGRLSVESTQRVLDFLDHRRRAAAESMDCLS
eukprot:TRINITY_DN57192_c0_g1_i1.p2 TRINITY_DN57192_c0_g1~~TRINITY_DN57192_c0_g1_i1.p2  ORF type:complete len:229 (-),score=29.78 TRINITY_DN57192_c0_g1_i1:1222-1842(-)